MVVAATVTVAAAIVAAIMAVAAITIIAVAVVAATVVATVVHRGAVVGRIRVVVNRRRCIVAGRIIARRVIAAADANISVMRADADRQAGNADADAVMVAGERGRRQGKTGRD